VGRHIYVTSFGSGSCVGLRSSLVQDAAGGESSLGAWLDRRGLTFEEVATVAYPAVEDAASRYDPAKDKVLKSAERAALQVLAEQAEVEFSLHVYPKRDQKARYLSLDEAA